MESKNVKRDRLMDNDLLIDGKMMVIRHGKSSFRIVEVVSDEEAEYHERLRKARWIRCIDY